jgi:hypothetical protein
MARRSVFMKRKSVFSKSVFAKRTEPNIGQLPTPGKSPLMPQDRLPTSPRATSNNTISRNEPSNPHKTNESAPEEPENEPNNAPNLSPRAPACYTTRLWQCSPPPGIITIIIGRLVCGGSWLNPIL